MTSKEDTLRHIENVKHFIHHLTYLLHLRGNSHDKSKLKDPEVGTFDLYTEKLRGLTYGTDEYNKYLAKMRPALAHHYKTNRHHPEHFLSRIDGMNLVDLTEMVCDWKAATLRHGDGDIYRSIEINAQRFGISDQLISILRNTVDLLEKETSKCPSSE